VWDEYIQRHASAQNDIKEVLLVTLVKEDFASLEMAQGRDLGELPDVVRFEVPEPGDLFEFVKYFISRIHMDAPI
jgi:hypothetical protein